MVLRAIGTKLDSEQLDHTHHLLIPPSTGLRHSNPFSLRCHEPSEERTTTPVSRETLSSGVVTSNLKRDLTNRRRFAHV